MINDASLCYVVGAMPLDPGFILTPVPGDLVIAADKGYETLSRLGVHPGLVVGDFDSQTIPRSSASPGSRTRRTPASPCARG